MNDDAGETYNANSQIEIKITMLKSSLYDYNDTEILVKGTITAFGKGAAIGTGRDN